MKKYLFSLIFIVLIVITILVLINVTDKKETIEPNIKIEGNIATIDDQTVEGLKVANISFELNGNVSNVNLELRNETEGLIHVDKIIGIIYDNKDEEISTIELPFYCDIQPGKTVSSGLVLDGSLYNAKSIKFRLEN